MKRLPTLPLLALALVAAGGIGTALSAVGQTQQSGAQDSPFEDEVVRITTNLVQVDAVVTDKDGRQVTDLRPEDFEILEDGKRRAITNFAYVRVGAGAATLGAAPAAKSKGPRAVAPPFTSLRPGQVRRTVALVLDDLLMSFEDVVNSRRAMKKFVDEQMQPGDLVAVLRTSAGTGALQQFTSDKRLLHAAIDRLRWSAPSSGGINAVESIDMAEESESNSPSPGGRQSRADAPRDARKELEEARTTSWVSASLQALNQIVQGLQELPGRKAVVLVSDGLPLKVGDELSTPLMENMRRVIEGANRASVVVYTIDARGLQDLLLTTADTGPSPSGAPKPRPERLYSYQRGPLAARRNAFFAGQDGLIHLAERTGGFNVRNTNDIAAGIQRAAEDQDGYYLLGYRPDEGSFERKPGAKAAAPDFRKLVVKVRGRGGLRVRARNGFYAVPEERVAAAQPAADQLRKALVSPFTSAGVSVGLTSLYGNEAGSGSFVRSLLHFDVRELSFEARADGRVGASVEVLAVLIDGAGEAVDMVRGTHTFSVAPDSLERLKREGMDYVLNVPLKKPGGYQLRVAVRDTTSGKIGTASRFVEAPDFEGGGLALSGLIISGSLPGADKAAKPPVAADAAEVESGPAVRRLRQGMMLDYGLVVYNARAERATGRPKLTTQVFLFRGGQQVYAGTPTPLDTTGQGDLRRIVAGGRLQLGAATEPGEYALQVAVTDAARPKPVTMSQWIDFEVVR